jgi:hypothetical protein
MKYERKMARLTARINKVIDDLCGAKVIDADTVTDLVLQTIRCESKKGDDLRNLDDEFTRSVLKKDVAGVLAKRGISTGGNDNDETIQRPHRIGKIL